MSIDPSDTFLWPTAFSCVLMLDDILVPNNYNFLIGMMPHEGTESTSIGLKKIKQFISRYLQNSILIHHSHELLPNLKTLKTNIVQLPKEPSDYFFAYVMFRKLTAISKNHFIISQLTIDSNVGDRVQYEINANCNAYDNILNIDGWWNQDNLTTNEFNHFPIWDDFELGGTKFSPKLVKGGRDENNQQIR